MKPKYTLLYLAAAAFFVILLLDFQFIPTREICFLPVLVFWISLGQGAIALSAAVTLSNGRWLSPVTTQLNRFYIILPISIAGFILFTRHLGAFPWYTHRTFWFTPTAFVVRNLIILVTLSVIALLYVDAVEVFRKRMKLYAGLYITIFVVSQSFMAFDWVMVFDYPFINTLFGGYFFVESLYMGVVVAALVAAIFYRKNKKKYAPVLRDSSTFMLGLALLWGGLFYSQYLVIWYGNIPEEVAYIAKRIATPGTQFLGLLILLTLFVIPFFSLLPKRAKVSPKVVIPVGIVVLTGLLIERIVFIISVFPINLPVLILQHILFGFPFVYFFKQQIKKRV